MVSMLFVKQKTAYESRISDWSSDVCSSDLDGIATITMDRPEVRNALDAATSRLIDEMLSRAEADADVGVIIVTGAGDKAFCSGMDLKEAARTGRSEEHTSELQSLMRISYAVFCLKKKKNRTQK